MRISDVAKRHNEMFVAQRFARWYHHGEDEGELAFGEPPQTDVLRRRGEWVAEIEIADAYFGEADARELFGSLRARIPAADTFSAARSVGVAEGGFLTADSSHGMPDLTIPLVLDRRGGQRALREKVRAGGQALPHSQRR